MAHEDPDQAEIGQRVIDQFMELYFLPEIKARQEAGRAETPFRLMAAQVVFFPDGRKPMVRLNREIVAVGKVRLKEGVTKKEGEPVYVSEIVGYDRVSLPEDDCPDCGHATLLSTDKTWLFAFDFGYNRRLSRKHLQTAREFLESAEAACQKRQWAAFADTLFSAAELTAKAVLLSMAEPKFRAKTTHRAVHSRFNRFASPGNVDQAHRQTFNTLSELRSKARYLTGELALDDSSASALLNRVREFMDYVSSRYPTDN